MSAPDSQRVTGSAYRQAVLELLGDADPFAVQLRGLEPQEGARAGIHAVRGRETIEDIIKLTAGHDLVHCRQIERIKRQVVG